jgi:hypothetical protein
MYTARVQPLMMSMVLRVLSKESRVMRSVHPVACATIATCLVVSLCIAADAKPPVDVKVVLGQTIERTWDDIRADGYAYGPRQTFDAKTNETRVFLPYGNNPRLYAELRGMTLADTTHFATASANTASGAEESVLTYRIVFDQPISAFRPVVGPGKVELAQGQTAGVEYSVDDGATWKPVVEFKTSTAPQMMVDKFKAENLNATTLLLRLYARGGGRIQFMMSGHPSWGDAATSFVGRQLQVYATAAGAK